ncbi:hypothetical protein [Paraglaciecola psychrophila]|uniref:Aspartate racemase n=1 Tax=Paraglaciecola psychrophila 170 TaxID=1129794 RepID=K7A9D3_9ALTE|nr:aspartate racemase [Paraglaciecola psychrophila 170]GAC37328.1 hypothetical protein GPSY_1699 [Paraglaciecola psychrophila 170]
MSLDFAEIEALHHQGDWQKTASILSDSAKSLEAAGAVFFSNLHQHYAQDGITGV